MKIKHGKITQRILADPDARRDLRKVLAGKQDYVMLKGRKYYVLSDPRAALAKRRTPKLAS